MAERSGAGEIAIPDALPILPLRDGVVFPQTAVPLAVSQPRSVRLVDEVMRGNRLLALVAQRDPQKEPAGLDELDQMPAGPHRDIAQRNVGHGPLR